MFTQINFTKEPSLARLRKSTARCRKINAIYGWDEQMYQRKMASENLSDTNPANSDY